MWFAVAMAAPSVEMTEDNRFRGTIEVPADVATVRTVIADPVKVSKIDGSGTEVTVLRHEGECLVIQSVTHNPLKTVRYITRQCPTDTGIEGKLVESNAFTHYRNAFVVTPTSTGSKVEYQLDMESNVMVPQFVINSATRKGMENLLSRLEEHLGAAATPR